MRHALTCSRARLGRTATECSWKPTGGTYSAELHQNPKRLQLRRADLVGNDPKAFELVRSEGDRQRHVCGVTPSRNQHAPDPRSIVAWIEGVPGTAQVGLEPSRE